MEKILNFKCPNCKNILVEKLSSFMQYHKDVENQTISFNRRCHKCKESVKFTMKISAYVSVIKNEKADDMVRIANSKSKSIAVKKINSRRKNG